MITNLKKIKELSYKNRIYRLLETAITNKVNKIQLHLINKIIMNQI